MPFLPLGADEHIETEKMLADSGIVYPPAAQRLVHRKLPRQRPGNLEHGVFIGAAGDGKIASATRADYAVAAARVISETGHEGKVYELAGDSARTLTQLAAELPNRAGKSVTYQNLSEADFAAALKKRRTALMDWRICWRILTLAHRKAVCLMTAKRLAN